MSEWQPIETAPKDKAVLVYHNAYTIAHFNTTLGRWIGYGRETLEFATSAPTHWMPLPPPPMGS